MVGKHFLPITTCPSPCTLPPLAEVSLWAFNSSHQSLLLCEPYKPIFLWTFISPPPSFFSSIPPPLVNLNLFSSLNILSPCLPPSSLPCSLRPPQLPMQWISCTYSVKGTVLTLGDYNKARIILICLSCDTNDCLYQNVGWKMRELFLAILSDNIGEFHC